MGTLFVVATPIGNLEDITLRALRVLKEVDLIAAEDTRKTMRLLSHYDIHTPLSSYHRHSSADKRTKLLETLRTKNVALVSEAGMPGVSDPGQDLIAAAIEAAVPVVPVPGPSALLSGLVVSGLPTDSFLFLGFLPRVKSDRRKLLSSVRDEPHTLIVFEAPHRFLVSLSDMLEMLGDRKAAAARELTKLHEEIVRGRLSDLIDTFETRPPRGEFTVVIAPAEERREAGTPAVSISELATALRREGLSSKDAIRRLMQEGGASRRDAYRAWLESAT